MMRTSRTRGERPAFTLTELLVVVGIIALLLGILIPVVGRVMRQGLKTTEKNNLRNIGLGWMTYSSSYGDALMPGYMSTEVQRKWKVRFAYPDGSEIPPANSNFSPTAPNIAGPWTWRLAGYVDYNFDLLRGYTGEEGGQMELQAKAETVALEPSFGYNGLYMGGWYYADPNSGIGSHALYSRFNTDPDGNRVGIVAKSIGQIRRPSEMLVFMSCARGDLLSTQRALAGPSNTVQAANRLRYDDETPGFHIVAPPTLAGETMWAPTFDDYSVNVYNETYGVPIGRHTGTVARMQADGAIGVDQPQALLDMRRWCIDATSSDWTHTDHGEPLP